jgi:hypothetical protein
MGREVRKQQGKEVTTEKSTKKKEESWGCAIELRRLGRSVLRPYMILRGDRY